MDILKAVFSGFTIVFGAVGLMRLLPYDIALPFMFVFLGAAMLANAKECYDKGSKKDAVFFYGVAIFVYAVTVYNLIVRFV